MEAKCLLKNLKETSENEESYPNENVYCLNSLLGIKMNGSTLTVNTAISSSGRKSGIEDTLLHEEAKAQEEEEADGFSPDPRIVLDPFVPKS